MKRYRLLFAGSGGQGIITAAILLAKAAVIYEGLNAVQSQSYGAEARGGLSRSDVIISNEEIYFPKVIQPNILICLTQRAYNNFFKSIRPGGILIVDDFLVHQEHTADAITYSLPLYSSLKNELNTSLGLNICTLGALVGLTNIVKPDSIINILKESIPPHYLELNFKAFELGLKMVEGKRKFSL
jgi:2-oxoglutarate ferredoxin oxidoreductase subunit gamma